MSALTGKEIEYMRDQRLGRLATANASGVPHVVPVAFRYSAEWDTIDIGGHNLSRSKKFRDVRDTGRAAFVVDDVLSPWRVRGRAEVLDEGGEEIGPGFDPEVIRIFPQRIVGCGIDSDGSGPNARTVG